MGKTTIFKIIASTVFMLLLRVYGHATSRVEFYYNSELLQFEAHKNLGSEDSLERFFSQIDEALPLILGLQNQINATGKPFRLEFDIGYGNASYRLDNQPAVRSQGSLASIVKKILEIEGFKAQEITIFAGYTLEIVKVSNMKTGREQLERLQNEIVQKELNEEDANQLRGLVAMEIDGDEPLLPIWLKSSHDGVHIEYGIFHNSVSAKAAAEIMGFSKARPVRKRFHVNNLNWYFH